MTQAASLPRRFGQDWIGSDLTLYRLRASGQHA